MSKKLKTSKLAILQMLMKKHAKVEKKETDDEATLNYIEGYNSAIEYIQEWIQLAEDIAKNNKELNKGKLIT